MLIYFYRYAGCTIDTGYRRGGLFCLDKIAGTLAGIIF